LNPKLNKGLLNAGKLILTGLALWLVWNKIDPEATWQVLKSLHPSPFLLALVLFNLSKIISSFRLNTYFQAGACKVGELENLRLYYVGMFYNLFLPGGIGGDGYKVYRLNKLYHYPVKALITSSLLDRLSGLVALLALTAGLSFMADNWLLMQEWNIQPLIIPALLLLYPAWWLVLRLLFRIYLRASPKADLLSLGVQFFQVLSAFALLYALGVGQAHASYLFLFLISSVVAVLPFTIGGVGARELVMVLGVQYLPVEVNTAVAFSLLFFIVTVLSSLPGVFLKH
jgi:uncharacterized membrane protein YbhN (UPF0104 family)